MMRHVTKVESVTSETGLAEYKCTMSCTHTRFISVYKQSKRGRVSIDKPQRLQCYKCDAISELVIQNEAP